MATDVPRIAVGQMCASSDVEKNFEVVADLCSQAKDRGARCSSSPSVSRSSA